LGIVKLIELPHETKVGIWHIEEKDTELEKRLQLDAEELALLASIKDTKRYQHWLGSRVLLRTMLETDEFISLKSDARHKPYIENFPHEVSISHSGEFAAVIISKEYEVGTDIEKISPKVLKVAPRFLNENELMLLDGLDEEARMERGIIFWSAKESLYKLYARGNVRFRTELVILPGQDFTQSPILGGIRKFNCNKDYDVFFLKLNGYIVCYTYGEV
jgi:phosphopantetheinyl transferase